MDAMNILWGFVGGMIIGLVASAVIATLILPAGVAYQHLTFEGKEFECVSWREQMMCEPATNALSLKGN